MEPGVQSGDRIKFAVHCVTPGGGRGRSGKGRQRRLRREREGKHWAAGEETPRAGWAIKRGKSISISTAMALHCTRQNQASLTSGIKWALWGQKTRGGLTSDRNGH